MSKYKTVLTGIKDNATSQGLNIPQFGFCRIYFREVWFLHKTEILGVMTPLTF